MAAPIDERISVPIDDPNADTEWYIHSTFKMSSSKLTVHRNDILRKHKIIPEKPASPTPLIEEAILEGRRLAH